MYFWQMSRISRNIGEEIFSVFRKESSISFFWNAGIRIDVIGISESERTGVPIGTVILTAEKWFRSNDTVSSWNEWRNSPRRDSPAYRRNGIETRGNTDGTGDSRGDIESEKIGWTVCTEPSSRPVKRSTENRSGRWPRHRNTGLSYLLPVECGKYR